MMKADKSLKKSSPLAKKPFTPILDEMAIVATLSMSVDPNSSNEYLRTAAVMASIDAHDRQLLRDAFVQMASRAFKLNETLRILEMAMRFQLDLRNEKMTREELLEALKTMAVQRLAEAEELRAQLLHDMKLTAECAWENDVIN